MIDERYAAGFFDGEGCVHVARNVRVVISGCFVPGLLDRFAERWGGKVLSASWSNRSRRPGVRWEITGGNADNFLRDVLPHLIEKREQAEMGIQYRMLKQTFGIRGGKGYNAEQRSQILEIEQRIRAAKGVTHCYA